MMKHSMKKNGIMAIAAIALCALILPLREGKANVHPPIVVTCDKPIATVTMQSASAVSFAWDAVAGATEYRVWYERQQDNFSSSTTSTGNTNITFTNLPAGTYKFYFATVCGMGTSTSYVIVDLIII
jgi:hypothetical protein